MNLFHTESCRIRWLNPVGSQLKLENHEPNTPKNPDWTPTFNEHIIRYIDIRNLTKVCKVIDMYTIFVGQLF